MAGKMNVREGLRRVGRALGLTGGVIGLAIGALMVYHTITSVWQYHKFNEIISLPVVRKTVESPYINYQGSADLVVEDSEISQLHFTGPFSQAVKSGGSVRPEPTPDDWLAELSSVTMKDGSSYYRSSKVTISRCVVSLLALVCFPILGYVLPVGGITVLLWIGDGFGMEQKV